MPHNPKHRNSCKGRTAPNWCSCGLKRTGPNHDDGPHHNRSAKVRKPRKEQS